MSIFTKIAKGVASAGKAVAKVGKVVLPIAEKVAPLVALVGPATWRPVARVASGALPVLRRIIKPKGASMEGNPFTDAVEDLIKAYVAAKTPGDTLGDIFAFATLAKAGVSVGQVIKNRPKAEWAPQLREALDAKIGSEPDALIGDGPNALIKVNLKIISIETVSDIVFDAMEKAIIGSVPVAA